jgi:hypothetical protein
MELELIGPRPCEPNGPNGQTVRIGTLFTDYGVLYTEPPGVHAWQRLGFLNTLNTKRAAQNQPALTPAEEENIAARSVDLFFDAESIFIRPDPARMELAIAGDELLQGMVSKRRIKFLSVSDPRVRAAIKQRGESWRLSSIPKSQEAKERIVQASKVGIRGLSLYFYNRLTGTRWLTYQAFESLGQLDNAALASHLDEIAGNATHLNRAGRPEIDFFAADPGRFGAANFSGVEYSQLPPDELRAKYEELKAQFHSAVQEAFRQDGCHNKAWSERMIAALFLDGNETETEQALSGLSPEFFLQVQWLVGGRFEEGEFLLDPLFEEAAANAGDKDLQTLCDLRAKEIIYNLIRDYGDLEYINLGSIPESLSLDRPQKQGRRGVYLTEFRARSEAEPMKRFMRLQKWGVWEHLDEGKDLLKAIQESDEYTDYWLDRRLGCRQLGMNLCRRVLMRRLNELYQGPNQRYRGQQIRTTYFEREYVPGIATDKLPMDRYVRPGYAAILAKYLGRTAASALIVGRAFDPDHPAFDDGDEVVREGEDGLPIEILIGDHSGAFTQYRLPLEKSAAELARAVNRRETLVPNAKEFAQIYLEAFRAQFGLVQGDYRKRRRAFDRLFKHCKYDPAGSFAFRWECVLRRLDQAGADALTEVIRRAIKVLG